MPLQAIKDDAANSPTILICVSDADESAVAIRYGCLRAQRRKHHITILHVIEPTEFQGLAAITNAIREEREEQADELMMKMEQLAENHGVADTSLMVREDTLIDGILAAIEESPHINLIILAINPASHRAPKLMAALTEELGKSISVPIMMVPGSLTEEQIDLLS